MSPEVGDAERRARTWLRLVHESMGELMWQQLRREAPKVLPHPGGREDPPDWMMLGSEVRRQIVEGNANAHIVRVRARRASFAHALDAMRDDGTCSNKKCQVLESYYLDGLTWENVRAAYGVSSATCKKANKAAVEWIAGHPEYMEEQGERWQA